MSHGPTRLVEVVRVSVHAPASTRPGIRVELWRSAIIRIGVETAVTPTSKLTVNYSKDLLFRVGAAPAITVAL